MKNFVHIVDGTEVFMPRDVPALKEGAVPTVFPNLPKYMTKTLPKERKRRARQSSSVPAKKSRRDIDNPACKSVEPTPDDELDTTDEVPVKHFIFGLQLPSEYWSRQTFQHQNVACYQTAEYHKNKVPQVTFNKVAVFEVEAQTSSSCTIFLAGKIHCRRTIQSEQDAQELLVYAEKLSVCSGVGNTSEFKPLDISDCTTSSGHGLYATVCDGSISQGMFFGTRLSSIASVKTYLGTLCFTRFWFAPQVCRPL